MKVLMISIDKGLVGGKELGDVVERHRKYGEHVEALDIIVLSKKGFEERQISEKVKAIPTNSSSKFGYFFDALRIAKKKFQTVKYDLIVTQDPMWIGLIGAILKKNFNSKLLVHFHGDFSLNPLSRYNVSVSDGVRVMSKGQKDKLIRKGISAKKIQVISTPVDTQRFRRFEEQASEAQKNLLANLRKQAGDKKIILAVGRDDKVKDFESLYEAVRIIREKNINQQIGFWRLGSTKLPSDLSDISVGFDNIATMDIPAYYLASYMTVLPSISESFGKVLVEANACGKPVVATATTGAQEVIKDGYNGFLVPIGDANGLAEKIVEFLDNPKKAKEMGENGRRMVSEKYSDNTEKIIGFWKDIVNAKTAKGHAKYAKG